MNNPQIQRKEAKGKIHRFKVTVDWMDHEPFSLSLRKTSALLNQKNRERSCYVKLVIDLPDYRPGGRAAGFRRHRGHRRLDRPNIVRCLPGAVPGVSDRWPQTRRLTRSRVVEDKQKAPAKGN